MRREARGVDRSYAYSALSFLTASSPQIMCIMHALKRRKRNNRPKPQSFGKSGERGITSRLCRPLPDGLDDVTADAVEPTAECHSGRRTQNTLGSRSGMSVLVNGAAGNSGSPRADCRTGTPPKTIAASGSIFVVATPSQHHNRSSMGTL